jgi:hypothetical protein
MSHLRELLDDVLSRRRAINDRSTFDLLRHIAPDKTRELNDLEGEAISRRTLPTITAVERIKLELESRSPKQGESEPVHQDPTVALTRTDLDDILQGRRYASPSELEWLLSHKRELRIDSRTEFDLRAIASKLSAKARQSDQRRPASPADEFITKTLGIFQTAYGDLTRDDVEKVESVRRSAAKAIFECRNHTVDRCRCWAFARTDLYQIRVLMGEKSALGIAALAVWNSLDALAATPRPEL